MKIKNLHIENFRCFTILDISFEQLTTLVGENGTGKTAVLEALHLALSPSFVASRINEQDFNSEDSGEIIIRVFFDGPFSVNLADGYQTRDILCDGVSLQVKRREKASPGKALSEEFTVTHHVVPQETVQKTDEGWRCKRQNGTDFEFTIRHLSFPLELKGFPRCFYFDRHRENQSKIGFNSTLHKVAQEYNWRFRKSLELEKNKRDFQQKWDALYDFVISNVDEKKLKDTFDPVKTNLKSFLGEKYEALELSILNLEQPFTDSFFSLRVDLNQVEYSRMGAGISMILAYFLLETISRLSKEQLVILVDEPEFHLHPQLKQKLREHLKNSAAQIIVSTHSETMIDVGDWRSIKRFDARHICYPSGKTLETLLEYNGTSQSIEKNLEEMKQFYQDKTILFRENNEMFFARACLLVEGPVDKYGVTVLARLVKGFDLSGLTIVSCNGKDKILYYQLICRAFEIPFFTLFDKDGKSEEDPRNKKIISWADGGYHYSFSHTFEHLLGTENAEHKASATMQAIESCKILPNELSEAFEKIKKFLRNAK